MSALTLHSFKNPLPSIEPFIPANASARERAWMARLDREATELGERIAADHGGVEALRIRAEDYRRKGLNRFLVESNAELANDLARDVRLAGIGEIIKQARGVDSDVSYWSQKYLCERLLPAIKARETLRAQLVGSVALALQAAE